MRGITILFFVVGVLACRREDKPQETAPAPTPGPGSGSASLARPRIAQVPPPVDLKSPPGDATKTASGLIYKKLVASESGAQPKRNDTVLVNYTGWRQASGETFYTNRARNQPMPLNLSQTAPGFTEALQLLRKGEKAVLWVPPAIGYKSPPTQGSPETLVYEVEVVDIQPAPAIPDNVGKPPDNAQSLKSGTRFVVVRTGTGTDKARAFDTITFNYTAWDATGRMVDSTETRKHSVTAPPYKQSPAMAEMLTGMTAGQRTRFWVDAEKMARGGKPVGGVDVGQLCYEIEVLQIAKAAGEPPPPPADVAKPPADAKKSPKGVFYRVLKAAGSSEHPSPTDQVKVNYTGWTTDGQMFDSSALKGQPAQFSLKSVVAGWTDVIPLMGVGDRIRAWIPTELAYKGAAGKPAGMLVFDIELLGVVPRGEPASPH